VGGGGGTRARAKPVNAYPPGRAWGCMRKIYGQKKIKIKINNKN